MPPETSLKPILIVHAASFDAAVQLCGGTYEVIPADNLQAAHGRRALVWTNGLSESIAAEIFPHCPHVKVLDADLTANEAIEQGWQYDQFRAWASGIVRVWQSPQPAPQTAPQQASERLESPVLRQQQPEPSSISPEAQPAVASGGSPSPSAAGLHFPQNTGSPKPPAPSPESDSTVRNRKPRGNPKSVAPDRFAGKHASVPDTLTSDADASDVNDNDDPSQTLDFEDGAVREIFDSKSIEMGAANPQESNGGSGSAANPPLTNVKPNKGIPYVPLGVHANMCYYRLSTGKIVAIRDDKHTKAALIKLAPIRFWGNSYPKSNPAMILPGAAPEPDWPRCINDTLNSCQKLGEYTPEETLFAHAEKRSVNTQALLPDTTEKGTPLSTIENLKEILDRLGIVVRYNVITKTEEIRIPNHGFSVDNQANAAYAWIVSWCARFNYNTDKVGDFLTYIADQQPFNPVAEWITSKPWDGCERLAEFIDTIKAEDELPGNSVYRLKHLVMRRWLISCVAGAFEPNGVSAKGVLVFQGKQHIGKTAWFKSLAPAEMNVLRDGMLLRPDDKDSVKQIVSNWIVELGELDATFKRSDIAQLKAFIPKDRDILRRAYARKESEFVRRTLFFASVNPREFLHDTTGNVRFWTIACKEINYNHGFDMQQIWAEVYELYKKKEPWHLSIEESLLLEENNAHFEVIDHIQEAIQTRLEWGADQELWEWKTTSEVLGMLGLERPTQSDMTRAGIYIRKYNGDNTKRSSSARLVLVPPKRLVP